jgi:MarR family transcriptional regulator, organic hydroperoxide resistance regulator
VTRGSIAEKTSGAGERARFDDAWEQFTAAVRRARSRVADRPDAKLTPAQFRLLAALEDAPSLSVGELAQAAGVSSPTATRMLDGLEQCGIVKREPVPGDRRRTAVRPTAKGRRALAETRERVDAARERIYAQLSPEDREQAERLLVRLAEAVEQI